MKTPVQGRLTLNIGKWKKNFFIININIDKKNDIATNKCGCTNKKFKRKINKHVSREVKRIVR